MPIPFILGAAAILATATGVGTGAYGAKKMYDAKQTMDRAESIRSRSIRAVETQNKETTKEMDELGKLELVILSSFDSFSDLVEKIQNRPEFDHICKSGVKLPKYTPEELKSASVGAALLLGSLGGAGLGAAGGIAASGATTAAVMALGTASTGTAISSLSGVVATNAALAALGGGSLAAGGGRRGTWNRCLGGLYFRCRSIDRRNYICIFRLQAVRKS